MAVNLSIGLHAAVGLNLFATHATFDVDIGWSSRRAAVRADHP
jgi:hypothetical protein